MGQYESFPQYTGAPSPDWRYTIQTMPIEHRVLTINKDQYKFSKQLGSGAFGSVYSARNASDNKPVAIKVVSLATFSAGDGEVLAHSILTEIEMSKRLARASNHVVHMYDFDFHRHTGLAFLVMELGEKDLEKALKERSRLPPAGRKEIWRQLVDIAMALFNNKIVHLDIKPQNLVVFPGNRVKIVDLGIAQKAYKHNIGSNGTWLYSAPEVTSVAKHHVTMHTSKADVWSWGAVLYRMTYLRPPEYTQTSHHPPKNHPPSRDPNLIDVLRHALVLDPRERADPAWLQQHPYTTSP